jgi:hypothetical protein
VKPTITLFLDVPIFGLFEIWELVLGFTLGDFWCITLVMNLVHNYGDNFGED